MLRKIVQNESFNRCGGGSFCAINVRTVAIIVIIFIDSSVSSGSKSKSEKRDEKISEEKIKLSIKFCLYKSVPFRFEKIDEDTFEKIQVFVFILRKKMFIFKKNLFFFKYNLVNYLILTPKVTKFNTESLLIFPVFLSIVSI